MVFIFVVCIFLSITPDHIKLMQTSIHLQPIEMNQLNLFIFLFKYYSNSFWFEAFLSVGLKYFLQLSFTFDSFVQKWYQINVSIEKCSYFYSLESIRNWLTANWVSLLILACHLFVRLCMGLCVCALTFELANSISIQFQYIIKRMNSPCIFCLCYQYEMHTICHL